MIYIIITSYNEPKATVKSVRTILNQEIPKPYKILVSDPFIEIKTIIQQEFKNNPEVEFFLDPGEGKSECLNLLLEMYYSDNKDDLFIFTDGDVFVGENAIKHLLEPFKDSKVGLVCGHPVSMNSKNNKFGYISHLFFDEMNKIRVRLSNQNKFFRISGYLFTMRNGIVKEFPKETSEDKVIPAIFWKNDYKIKYIENATVYVLNPQNMKDYLIQKVRNIKSGMTLQKNKDFIYEKESNFLGESLRGIKVLFTYPKNIKEVYWTFFAMYVRLRAWIQAFYEVRFKKQKYKDGWRENTTESTKPLD